MKRMEGKCDKRELVERIHQAAIQYRKNLIGKSFLIIYEGKFVKVHFKAENFLHFCGVDTCLYAKEFYRKAANGLLKSSQIGFSDIHPYVFADIKTKNLMNALSILQRDSLIITDVSTQSRTYELGTTDLEVVLCFDSQMDENGNKVSNIFIPYSLRVEEIANNRYSELYQVDYVLSKPIGAKTYTQIEYGDEESLYDYLNYCRLNEFDIDIPELSENEREDDDYER